MRYRLLSSVFAATVAFTAASHATELEVTHWWTSGGEAAGVAEFAKAFEAAGHTWIDGAIAGRGSHRTVGSSSVAFWAAIRWAPRSSTTVARAEELVEAGPVSAT